MRRILLLIIILVSAIPITALAQSDFDPSLPPEPNALYKVVVKSTPIGSCSGTGSYKEGTTVTISVSGSTGYTFLHWKKNGEVCSTSRSFTYTVEAVNTVEFEAVWEYDPSTPSEPNASNQYRLYLENNIADACSFNRTSGDKVEAGTYVTVTATKSQAYKFLGWYEGGQKISSSLSFSFLMPYANTTLTAMFEYSPVLPDEPERPNIPDPVYQKGDLNQDGLVNIVDVTLLVDAITDVSITPSVSTYDLNSDGVVNSGDVIYLVNFILTHK